MLDINHYNALFLDYPGQNDATNYGVQIHPHPLANPTYRCHGVHHPTPDENAGNHHISLDILDEQGQPHPDTSSKVVLTAPHLNHQHTNCRPDNLRAWCQR